MFKIHVHRTVARLVDFARERLPPDVDITLCVVPDTAPPVIPLGEVMTAPRSADFLGSLTESISCPPAVSGDVDGSVLSEAAFSPHLSTDVSAFACPSCGHLFDACHHQPWVSTCRYHGPDLGCRQCMEVPSSQSCRECRSMTKLDTGLLLGCLLAHTLPER